MSIVSNTQYPLAIQNLLIRRPYQSFVAGQVLPVISTPKLSAVYYRYDSDFQLGRRVDTSRALNTEAKPLFVQDPQPVTISITPHALAHSIPGEFQLNDASLFSEEQVAFDLMEALLQSREQDFIANTKAALIAAGNHTDISLSPGVQWNSTTGNQKPVTDLKTAVAQVEMKSGKTPNVICMSRAAADAVVLSSQFVGITAQTRDPRSVYTGTQAMAQAIADLVGVERVLIGAGSVSGAKNTAGKGQTPVRSSLWGGDVLIAYYEPPSTQNASLGFQFLTNGTVAVDGIGTARDGILVARSVNPSANSVKLTVHHYRHDEVAANANAGWWLSNVV